MFQIGFVIWTEKLAWIWGTYAGIQEHSIFGPCPDECDQPTPVFSSVIGKMDNAVFTAIYEAVMVEVMMRYYIILPDTDAPSDPDLFRDIKLPFDVADDAELERTSQLSFFQAILKRLKGKRFLKPPEVKNWIGRQSSIIPSMRWTRSTGKNDMQDFQQHNDLKSL